MESRLLLRLFFHYILLLLIGILGLSGCVQESEVRVPKSISSVSNDSESLNSIALMRLVINGQSDTYRDTDGIWLYHANIDKNEAPNLTKQKTFSPSQETKISGWIYIAAQPGTYYLLATPNGFTQNPTAVLYSIDTGKFVRPENPKGRKSGAFWHPSMSRFVFYGKLAEAVQPVQAFRFVINKDKPITYIGTLNIQCEISDGLFGKRIETCPTFSVSNESDIANSVASKWLANYGQLESRTMTEYGELIADKKRKVHLRQDQITIQLSSSLDSLNNTLRTARPSSTIHGVGQAAGILNLFAILADGIGSATREKAAEERRDQLQSCFNSLENNFSIQENLISKSKQIILNNLNIGDSTQTGNNFLSLVINIEKIQLRECVSQDSYCLEIIARTRLIDTAINEAIYDSILVYGNNYREDPTSSSYRLYQLATTEKAQCIEITKYCNVEGAGILRKEFERGLQAIAKTVSSDIIHAH